MAGAALAATVGSRISHGGERISRRERRACRAATRASESAAAPAAVTSARGLAAILRWPPSATSGFGVAFWWSAFTSVKTRGTIGLLRLFFRHCAGGLGIGRQASC